MWFLGWFNPGNWLESVSNGLPGTISKGIRTLFFSLDELIYGLIINLYELFETLCTARLLNNEIMNQIADRVGLILGLIMFFYITFEFVKMMIDPDSLEDKQKGAAALIKRTLMVIVMLGVSTFAFNSLYTVQRTVIKSNVISKLILPYSIETDKFGAVLSEELMHSFYYLEKFDENSITNLNDKANYESCKGMVTAFRNQIINSSRFDLGHTCLNESIEVTINSKGGQGTYNQEVYIIDFNWMLSAVAGIAVVYFLLMYCISIGVRMIQLTVLEVISPMAIVAYLSPKQDNTFTKWSKIYVSTYIDVFIRMAIINFIIFLIATIFDASADKGFTFWTSVGNPTDWKTKTFFIVVIIIALLAFAKKAPDLIKQLLPEGASKLGFGGWKLNDLVGGKTIGKVGKMGAGVVGGALGGAAIGLLSGSVGGAFGGLFKGAFSGLKGQGFSKTASSAWKSQRDSIKKMRDIKANGGNWLGYQVAKVQKGLGMRTAGDNDKQRVDDINTYIKYKDEIEGYAKNTKTVKTLERTYEAIKQAGRLRGESDDHYTARIEAARQNWKRAMEATITSSMTGNNINYHEAAIQRNVTTGKWEVVDVAATSTITHSSIEAGLASSISSKQQEMNRVGNSLGYGPASDYGTMDTINNQAKADVASITSTKEYAQHKANNG